MTIASKAKKRSKPPAARLMPHQCRVLAVDPGNTSGWAVFDHGKLIAWGVLSKDELFGDGPASVIREQRPRVVVLERPFRVRFQNQTGIGAGMRIWKEHAAKAGLKERTLLVYPSQWRRILPKAPKGEKRDRKAIRAVEADLAREFIGQAAGGTPLGVHPDVAPAVLMGRWAAFSGEVYELLFPQVA